MRKNRLFQCLPTGCRLRLFLTLFLILLGQTTASAWQHEHTPDPELPKVAKASNEGVQAIKSFKFPSNWKMEQAVAEPDVANIVAFYVDNDGRLFVCETYRQERGVDDMRNHPDWLPDELSARTVQDRLAYMKKHLKGDLSKYTKFDDRIRLVTDTNNDGKFDRSVVYADRFNRPEQGTGAGVLHYRGMTYYTCIPDLVILQDNNQDGKAEIRKVPHTGYGVRIAFRGHDSHGLTIGPMGRLYYSIGDRGYNIKTPQGDLVDPESGAVFRCELDGSNLEVIAKGLRNPQELTFDNFGNLFSGDNNSDSGDKARWVYIAEGGDTGWRMYYQYLPDRGPFNREKIWHPYHKDTPAGIIPPITNFGDGPSGVAYYPGTGFGPEMENRFFMCDFRGQSSSSGIRSFRLKPKGAFFELTDSETPIWKILATDLQFGPDGYLYVSDWVHGWSGVNKGRVYRLSDKKLHQSPIVKEVQSLLAGGIGKSDTTKLITLLAHKDIRIRQEAQFELVRRNQFKALCQVAQKGLKQSQLAQLHGQWGMMQLFRYHRLAQKGQGTFAEFKRSENEIATLCSIINSNLDSSNQWVKSWAADLASDIGSNADAKKLMQIVRKESGQAAYKACLTIGKLQLKEAADAVMDLVAKNADADPIIRHGGIMALAGINASDVWAKAMNHPSVSVRLATAVAMGRCRNPQVQKLLSDSDVKVRLEAARAIHDHPIPQAMPALAKSLINCGNNDALIRRALNANFRIGGPEQADRLCKFVAQEDAPQIRRLEALTRLVEWGKPSPIDAVLGQHRPIGKRTAEDARNMVKQNLALILGTKNGKVNQAAELTAAKLGIKEVLALLKRAIESSKDDQSRLDALETIFQIQNKKALPLLLKYCEDPSAKLRSTATKLLCKINVQKAIPFLTKAVQSKSTIEKKAALDTLAEMESKYAKPILAAALEQKSTWEDLSLVKLELAQSIQKHQIDSSLKLQDYKKPKHPVAGQFDELIGGGDIEKGKKIFFQKTEVSCVRCHKIDGIGGEVGPDLTKVGSTRNANEILEAILLPNQTIAEGFQSEIILDIDGNVKTGVVRKETDEFVELIDADGKIFKILQDDIEQRKQGMSSMPDDIRQKLTRREIRDLVEYLKSLKQPSEK